MFDIAWQELMVIAVVALIFIGPKDLPRAVRTVTGWIRSAQRMAREFQSNVDEFVRESELQEMRDTARKMAEKNWAESAESLIDPKGELRKAFDDPSLSVDPFAPPSVTVDTSPTPGADAAADAAIADATGSSTMNESTPNTIHDQNVTASLEPPDGASAIPDIIAPDVVVTPAEAPAPEPAQPAEPVPVKPPAKPAQPSLFGPKSRPDA